MTTVTQADRDAVLMFLSADDQPAIARADYAAAYHFAAELREERAAHEETVKAYRKVQYTWEDHNSHHDCAACYALKQLFKEGL